MNKKFYKSIILRLICGGVVGFVGAYTALTLRDNLIPKINSNIYIYLFIFMTAISSIDILYMVFKTVKLNSKIKDDMKNDVPKDIDKSIQKAMMNNSLNLILNFFMLSFMIVNIKSIPFFYILFPIGLFSLNIVLETKLFKQFSRLYPNKYASNFDKDFYKKYFETLDEGEKWVVYKSSYKAFMTMEKIFPTFIVTLSILSYMVNISSISILSLCVLWAVEKIVYFKECLKYDV